MPCISGRSTRRLFLLLALLLLTLADTCLSCEIRVRVPEDNSYAPFFVQDASGKWSGLSIELTEALLQEADCTPIYKAMPFARALYYLQQGKIDMMSLMTITEERKDFMHFVGPELDETVLLVTRKDAAYHIVSLNDLKKLPLAIGVERGKVYGKAFEKKRATDSGFRARLEEVKEVDSNEKKLALGRISGFLGYGYNVMFQVQTNPLYKDFAIHPFVIHQDWVYFGFSKKSMPPELLERMQKALERATKKGLFDAIRKRYTIAP